MREWSPPQGLIIQPGAILVPGRVGYVPPSDSEAERFAVVHERAEYLLASLCAPFAMAGCPGSPGQNDGHIYSLTEVSVARWDLSSLTSAELDSLQLAIDAQRQAGIGKPCAATVADRRALGGGSR